MNILVVVEADLKAGGGFSYAISMCALIRDLPGTHRFLFAATAEDNRDILKSWGCTVIDDLLLSTPQRAAGLLDRIGRRFRKPTPQQSSIDRAVLKHDIDLVYFLAPSEMALALTRAPYVFTVWDFCHRDWPEFPEVNRGGVFEGRENLYRNVLPRAVSVVVDSDELAEKAVRYYGVNRDRLTVLPFLMPEIDLAAAKNIDIISKYSLVLPYIFYPAQFWAHKNHRYIVEALALLKRESGQRIDAVFTGSDFGTLGYVLDSARELGISDQVHYLGFIPREDVLALYAQALALVMPTYFGPTNIPPLEALALGCPIIYSDLPYFREEYEGLARFVDINDPRSLADAIFSLMQCPDKALAFDGQQLSIFKENHSEHVIMERVGQMLLSCRSILSRWR